MEIADEYTFRGDRGYCSHLQRQSRLDDLSASSTVGCIVAAEQFQAFAVAADRLLLAAFLTSTPASYAPVAAFDTTHTRMEEQGKPMRSISAQYFNGVVSCGADFAWRFVMMS